MTIPQGVNPDCPTCHGTGLTPRVPDLPGDISVWYDTQSQQYICISCATTALGED